MLSYPKMLSSRGYCRPPPPTPSSLRAPPTSPSRCRRRRASRSSTSRTPPASSSSTPTRAPATGPTIIDTPDLQQCSWRPFLAGYFILDATATASALPLPRPELIFNQGRLGLIASPHGFMVAELRPVYGSDKAELLRFSSQVGEWVRESVANPLGPRSLFDATGVLSCSGRLWWIDLSLCLLSCDPFADAPVITAVHLPEGKALKYREAWGLLDKYRCVGVSASKLGFVDMYRNRNSRTEAAQISVWTLADYHPEASWTLEYEATFAEICNDPSYKATGLPRKIPVLALIHPTNPDVVGHLLGVDVRARKVVGCEVYELVHPPIEHVASRFVHAWKLPPALCSGSAKETDNGVNEELQQLHPETKMRNDKQELTKQVGEVMHQVDRSVLKRLVTTGWQWLLKRFGYHYFSS